ncbi:MAG: FtsQ-type POTRA domain-containing protein [Candidatus Aegiribacteria sp.]|nr:FtsQ-type POTRA domain-containing protein [Candidatus Aegiribacteria sp.]
MIVRRIQIIWILLLSGIIAFALAMAYRWFERGGAFDLATVRIRGIRQADSSAVCLAVEPLFGTSIWQINLEEVQDRLEDIPGIDDAEVSRELLNGMILRIELAEPIFAVNDSAGTVAVSTYGERLPVTFLTDTIPVVDAHSNLNTSVSASLAEWFENMEFEHDSLVFRYSDEGLSVFMSDWSEVLLGVDNLSGRWRDYCLLEASMSDLGNWEQVDMRYINQAILRRKTEECIDSGEES